MLWLWRKLWCLAGMCTAWKIHTDEQGVHSCRCITCGHEVRFDLPDDWTPPEPRHDR